MLEERVILDLIEFRDSIADIKLEFVILRMQVPRCEVNSYPNVGHLKHKNSCFKRCKILKQLCIMRSVKRYLK